MKEVIERLLSEEKDDSSFPPLDAGIREKLIQVRVSNLGIIPRVIIKRK